MDEIKWKREWFRYADMDLRAAMIMTMHRPIPIEIICYHCQQAAEKYLKAYLVFKTSKEPEHTQNLSVLCSQCESFDKRFSQIADECLMLNPHATSSIYPDESDLSSDEMNQALRYAENIKEFAPLVETRKEIGYEEWAGEKESTENMYDFLYEFAKRTGLSDELEIELELFRNAIEAAKKTR
jgi:HEPN domain-containing protein